MRLTVRRLLALAAFGLAGVAPRASAQAGTLGAPVTVSLNASRATTLGVSILSGGTQTIAALVPNSVNAFPTPVQVSVSWSLRPNSGTLSLVAFFTAPAAALVSGATSIPSSRVEARMTSGSLATFTPLDGTGVGGVGTAGGSRVLWTYPVCNSNFCRNQTRVDQLDLRLNLVGLPLPPGTYAGTLNLRAVTY